MSRARQPIWRFTAENVGLAALLLVELGASCMEDAWDLRDVLWAAATVLLVVFTLRRSAPRSVTRGPMAITATLGCYLIPSCFEIGEPPSSEVVWISFSLAGAAALIQLWAVLSLRTSFSLLPAARELVQAGPYRYLRHPMYFSYLVVVTAAVVYTPAWRNVGLALLAYGALLARAVLEEREMSRHSRRYARYRAAARWRFVPWFPRDAGADDVAAAGSPLPLTAAGPPVLEPPSRPAPDAR
ncbi:methyltransferase [Sorangium sp. So ce429]